MNTQLLTGAALVAVLVLAGCQKNPEQGTDPLTVSPVSLARVGSIDERFQSYNVEMLEVTGGAFWKPYGAAAATTAGADAPATPAGMDPNIYQYRPPLDLTNPRLRILAAALGPAYVRVSGTWANTTYFADTETPPAKPPKGFKGLRENVWVNIDHFSIIAVAACM